MDRATAQVQVGDVMRQIASNSNQLLRLLESPDISLNEANALAFASAVLDQCVRDLEVTFPPSSVRVADPETGPVSRARASVRVVFGRPPRDRPGPY